MGAQPSRFVDEPALRLAGLRALHAFDRPPGNIPAQWMRLVPRLPLPGQRGEVSYGAMEPGSEPRTFWYTCAVEVVDFTALPPDIDRLEIPASRFAIFTHEGHVSAFSQTIAAALGWLAGSGLKRGGAPMLERYGEAFDPQTGRGDLELWLPVSPEAPAGR